jgi:hypothetical protein
MEPEIMPPSGPDFEGVKVHVAHVRSLGVIGAILAGFTMLAALTFGLLALFGKALFAALIVKLLWPYVFSTEFTQSVFGTQAVPFFKVFVLLAAGSVVAKMLWPASWGRR